MNRENLVAFYEADLARYGPEDARSLHWVSSRTQSARFEVLYQVGPWDGVSVADVGSGLGDFVGFLQAKGHTIKPGPGPAPTFNAESAEYAEKRGKEENKNSASSASSASSALNKGDAASSALNLGRGEVWYDGYDVSPGMVQAAQRKCPQAAFHLRDVLEQGFVGGPDYVVASGTFNIRVEDHERWFRAMIEAMYAACRRAAAFNFLGLPPPSFTAASAAHAAGGTKK